MGFACHNLINRKVNFTNEKIANGSQCRLVLYIA